MHPGEHFLETSRFEFTRMKQLAEKAMAQCSDEEFSRRENESDNSIRIIVQHIAGNLLSRWTGFLSSDGEKPWRNRDMEFEQQELSREALMKKWEEGWSVLQQSLEGVAENNLMQNVTIRNEPITVTQAIMRQIAHYSYHVGQIVFIAKKLKGEKWQSLSIPKGKSAEFAAKGTYLKQNGK